MPIEHASIAFGPIPSRRLGRSLGINHIPAKHCSYSCVYCQVGATEGTEIERRAFYPVEEVVGAVTAKLEELRAVGEDADFLSFVPDGEPTLDRNLGAMIRGVKPLGVPVAVITNGTLLGRPDVRADLEGADLVSVKVDATDERIWRRVNRPNGRIDFPMMLDGILEFAREYRGELLSDTMLIAGINDGEESLEAVAEFLGRMKPRRAYIAVPTRPPAEARVRPPDEAAIARAYAIVSARVEHVFVLTGAEHGRFGRTGDPAENLLAILAVHPMREAAVRQYVAEAGATWSLVERLAAERRIVRVPYRGEDFYVVEGSRAE